MDKNPKKNADRYIDPTGELPASELKLADWYVRHELKLQKIGVFSLIFFCVSTIGFSLWQWGDYLLYGYNQDVRLLAEQAKLYQNYTNIQPLYKARDLAVTGVSVFKSGAGKYDFTAIVSNPNAKFIAYVDYIFTGSGVKTNKFTAAILPGQKRPIAVFGFDADQFPTAVQLAIESIHWHRVDPHSIRDVAAYMNERLVFSSSEFVFVGSSAATGASEPQVSFNLKNNSAFNFWQAHFYVELLNNGSRVGVVDVLEDQFRSGEMRAVSVNLFGGAVNVTSIVVTPVVDIFDPTVFMAP